RIQPRCVLGHASVIVLPLTLNVMFVGLLAIVDPTETLPSTARLLTHATLPPVIVNAFPLLTAPLNNWNLSPTAMAVTPIFVIVTVPVRAFVILPVATTMSLDCACDLSTRKNALPPLNVMLLWTVNVPMAVGEPAPSVPFVTITWLRMLPVPASNPPVIVVGPV